MATERGDPTTWAAYDRRQKEAIADMERRIAESLSAATPAELSRRREELVAMIPNARRSKGHLEQRIRQIDEELARKSTGSGKKHRKSRNVRRSKTGRKRKVSRGTRRVSK